MVVPTPPFSRLSLPFSVNPFVVGEFYFKEVGFRHEVRDCFF